MKTEAIKLMKNVVKSNVTERAEKAVSNSIKDGAEKLAKSQDAMSVQGKAMLKKYEKPEMKTIDFMAEDEFMVTSNNHGYTGGGTGTGTEEGGPNFANKKSIWEHDFDGGGSGLWKD